MRAEREFPSIPAWLRARQVDGVPAHLRRFGSDRRDLEIDFDHASSPLLVARVLALCTYGQDGRPVREEAILDLPVGLQLEALLALADMSDAMPFTWRFRCAVPQCRSNSEFELTADELSELADRYRESETITIDFEGRQLMLRRPTGRDQLHWLEAEDGAEPGAILRNLLVDTTWDELERQGMRLEAVETAVDEAMEDFDPLPAFEMQVVCPECGKSSTAAPALRAAALQRLVGAQEGLLDDVHRIALRYHWTEAEILDIPVWRRQAYLARIEAAETIQ